MYRIFFVGALGLSLSGCLAAGAFVAADEIVKGGMGKAERRAATLAALGDEGKDLIPRYIEIEDVDKEDGRESWTAETVIGNYRCTVMSGRSDATCTKI